MADMMQFDPGMAGTPPAASMAGAPPPEQPAQGGGSPAEVLMMLEREHPDVLDAMYESTVAALSSGELTPEELVQLGNMAKTAVSSPQAYGALVRFARENGMTDPLPEPDDPAALLTVVALVATTERVQDEMEQGGQGAQPGGKGGSKPGDGPIDGYQQDGRYMMPKDAVRRMGTDKLDSLSESPEAKEARKAKTATGAA